MDYWPLLAMLAYTFFGFSSSIDSYFMHNDDNPIIADVAKCFFNAILLALPLFLYNIIDSIQLKGLLIALVLGILWGIGGIMYFYAVKKKDAEVVFPLIEASIVSLTVILGTLFFGDSLTVTVIAGLLFLLTGMIAVESGKELVLPEFDLGSVMALGTTITSTIYFLTVNQLLKAMHPLAIAIPMYTAASVTAAVFAVITIDDISGSIKQLSPLHMLGSSVFASSAMLLTYTALSHGVAAQVFAFGGLKIVTIFLVAATVLDEGWNHVKLAGTGFVALGIALIHI